MKHRIAAASAGAALPLVLLSVLSACPAAAQADARIELRFDTSEAEAVLAIVEKQAAGQEITDADWRALFDSEPYRRLHQRETDMRRPFTDESFREFVLSDDLAVRAKSLRSTLDEWRTRDLESSARRVLHYLPAEARISARVYPVIKPQPNSFVYDLRQDPTIFIYLDPEASAEQFENTVAHELHHVGFASVSSAWDSVREAIPERVRLAVDWMGAFGEGFAMLAAAGDPDTHPHAASPAVDRDRWDRDMENFARDFGALEAFFLAVIDGRLATDEEIRERAFSFFGEQGPWYTVGYRMAVLVERRFGRDALIDCMLDPRRLLARYNAAAADSNAAGAEPLPLWSKELLDPIGT